MLMKKRVSINDTLSTNYHFLSAPSLFFMLSPSEYFEEHLILAINFELIQACENS